MVSFDRVGSAYPAVQLQEMLSLAQKQAPLTATSQYDTGSLSDSFANVMNGNHSQKISPSQFGLADNPSLQFATPGGGYVQVFGPLRTSENDTFFHDPNPVVIQKRTKPVTYVQKINLAYYKPPAPPAPGPVIIKEVRPPQAPPPPPLFVRIQPPPPPDQTPLVIREAPPPRPQAVPTTHLTRVLPAVPPPPPNVRVCGNPPQGSVERTLNNLGISLNQR